MVLHVSGLLIISLYTQRGGAYRILAARCFLQNLHLNPHSTRRRFRYDSKFWPK